MNLVDHQNDIIVKKCIIYSSRIIEIWIMVFSQ